VKIKNIFFDKKLISIPIVFIFFLVLLSTIYFFFNKKTETLPNVYKGSTFEITVPDGWSVATSSVYSDFTVISQDKKIKATRQMLSTSDPIIFLSTKDVGSTTLDEFVKKIKTNLVPVSYRYSYNNYKILEEATTTLNDTEAYILGTYFEVPNSNSYTDKNEFVKKIKNNSTTTVSQNYITKYRNLSIITIKDGKIYIVTATAQDEAWSKVEDNFRKVLINFNP